MVLKFPIFNIESPDAAIMKPPTIEISAIRASDMKLPSQSQQVYAALPAEQDRRGEDHPYAVCGRQHRGRDQVQSGVGEQECVVAVKGALYRSQDREGAHAVEHDARGQSLGQVASGPAGNEPVEASVQIQHGTYEYA